MDITVFPSLDDVSSAAEKQRIKQLSIVQETLAPAEAHFHSRISLEKQDGLVCLRGVATALGIQAAVLLLGFAVWRLI